LINFSATSKSNNKGQQGNLKSDGNRQRNGGCNGCGLTWRILELNSETLVFTFALLMAVVLVGGLMVVPPIIQQVDAKCTDGFKKNGDPCKPKKHNS